MENIFSARLRRYFIPVQKVWANLQEIRLRSGQPLTLCLSGEEWFLSENGSLCKDPASALRVQPEDIQESIVYICQYSLYAYEEEMRQGFITIRGGHRVGVAGQVTASGGRVQSISCVSSLNIRIAHQVKGCGEASFAYLWSEQMPCHTLIVSPPGGGKTTLLRDFIRLFSDGFKEWPGLSVSLVDERSEVGACHMGIPQNDIGIRTDVLSNCPKAEGIDMAVRSMAPKIIAFDELGNAADVAAVEKAIHSGCRVLATIHGNRLEDVEQRCGKGMFERYIFLNGRGQAGRISCILNREGRILCGG